MGTQTIRPTLVSATSKVTNPSYSCDASTSTYTTIAPTSQTAETLVYSFTKPANTTSIKLNISLKSTLGNVNTNFGVYGESYNPLFLSYIPTNTTTTVKVVDMTNIRTDKFIISVMDDINASAKIITIYDMTIDITTADTTRKIYLGNTQINDIRLGNTQVNAVYLGNTLVFQK